MAVSEGWHDVVLWILVTVVIGLVVWWGLHHDKDNND